MKIAYKNTFCDIVAFLWNHYIRSPFVIGFTLIVSAYIGCTMWKFTEEHTTIVIALVRFITTATVFPVIFLLIFFCSALSMISRKNKTFLTDSTIELTDNGIITEDRYERSERVWDNIQRLIRTKRFILVYVSQRQAIVVPRRAFLNDQEWDSFYEILKSHYRSN